MHTFGVLVPGPLGLSVKEDTVWAHVGDGMFKLNLFYVDADSAQSAAEEHERVEASPGFGKITFARDDGATWRVDYTLEDGTVATWSRIAPGRSLQCGVARVTPEVAAAVADACARTKKM